MGKQIKARMGKGMGNGHTRRQAGRQKRREKNEEKQGDEDRPKTLVGSVEGLLKDLR